LTKRRKKRSNYYLFRCNSIIIDFDRGDFGLCSLLIGGTTGVKSINGVSFGFVNIGDGEYIKAEMLSLSLKYGLCNGSEFERVKIKLD